MDFALVLFIGLLITGLLILWDRLIRRPRLAAENRSDTKDPILIEYSKAFFPVILIVFVLRSFVVEPFRIPSGSMLPTLHIGDFILVNKFIYGIRLPIVDQKILGIGEPERGDVMVFRYPHDESVNYIKRVIGVPGDIIEYRNKQLLVNGELVPQKRASDAILAKIDMNQEPIDHYKELLGDWHDILKDRRRSSTNMRITVPPGHYFVMGDNRDYSNDSRYWGFVPEENIVGRAFLIWFSWDKTNGGGVVWSRIGDAID